MEREWLTEHVAKVGAAFSYRLWQPGNAYRRWQMIYHESKPGTRGAIAVIPVDDDLPEGWRPVAGVFDFGRDGGGGHLTESQIIARLQQATRRLPVLDPTE